MIRTVGVGRPDNLRPMNLDPNTHAFVLATAFFTSIFFAFGAWLPVVLALRWVFPGLTS